MSLSLSFTKSVCGSKVKVQVRQFVWSNLSTILLKQITWKFHIKFLQFHMKQQNF